ncbi:hypothetical protein [Sabulibacter ruber]|uniref:hypothetical protein n=1 Tax=Sabulibacter ruber TaxID=2811901 RepID=UPI001A97A9B4|nr:hypothetical protein [Sabulibacter ruber]
MQLLLSIYLFVLLLTVAATVLLLLWEEKESTAGRISLKDKLLLGCATVIGFITLHLNCLLLSWHQKNLGNLVTVFTIIVLAAVCLASAYYLVTILRSSKTKRLWKVYVNGVLVGRYFLK